jgi:outer membrane protein OmpA-like peptidoglycan-associated protein
VIDTRPQTVIEPLEEETGNTDGHPPSALETAEAGSILNIKGIQFEGGRHKMLKSSLPVLKELLKILKDNPAIKIEIQGHICCIDNGKDGMDFDTQEPKLSVNRARIVYEYLVRSGIDKSRLSYKGFGRTRPLVNPELSPKDEQMNRRVDIMVISR